MVKPESTPLEDAIPSKEALAEVFPDIFKADEPAAPPAGENVEDVVKPPEGEPESEVDKYLSIEDLGDKLVKVKVGGMEKEQTLKDVIKGFQTEAYLSQKGDRLAKAVRDFEASKEPVVPFAITSSVSQSPSDEDDYFKEYVKPRLSEQSTEVQLLKKELSAVKDAMQPFQYQGRVGEIDKILKAQGYDDFNELLPQVEQQIMALPVEQQVEMDTPAGFMSIYKDLKILQMSKQAKEGGKTPKAVDTRTVPNVAVESGASVSNPSDDSTSKYNTAFQKAVQSGRDGDWAEVLKLKLEKSG